MIRLWGRLSSVNVQKVVWALEELDLAYERIDTGGHFGGNDTPEYRRMNPTGLVPTFEEDGFVLWESNAIVRYLAARSGGDAIRPADPRTDAEADRWMDWQATAFTPAMRDAFWQLVRAAPDVRDDALVALSLRASEHHAEILDRHLAGRRFVAGEAFSVGDIALGAAAHRWLNLPNPARVPRPDLERWYAGLFARSAAKRALLLPMV